MHQTLKKMQIVKPALTPEEDSIGDPEEQDDEIDDLLPADLWFLASGTVTRGAQTE